MKTSIYARLSDEDKNKLSEFDESISIQNQKSMLLNYAMEQGWEVYNIYSDEDYTGADRNRPAFKQLLEDAEKGKFDIILCKSQSRFTRELELVEKYIHGLFPIWGIRFVSIVDHADTEIPGNKKSRQINGLVNEWFLEDLSSNIRDTLTNRRQNGHHIGAFALYGYMKDPEQKGHLIIDPEAAEVVREVFALFSQGYGKSAIARMLNDREIPNPTEYKRRKNLRYKSPKSKKGTLWKYFAISNMLTNETYIGNLVQGKYGSVSYKTQQNKPRPKEKWIRVEGTHEPIIDRALWESVQELVKQKVKPFTVGTIGLFAKKTRCMHCGYTLRSCKNHKRHYLKCGTRCAAKDACIGSFISVEALEKAVLDELRWMVDIYLDKSELERQIKFNDDMSFSLEKVKSNMTIYEKKINELTKAVRELYMDKVRGIISENDFVAFSRDFSEEKSRIKKAYGETQEQFATVQEKMKKTMNHREKIEQYINLQELDREIVEKLIDYVSVGKKNPETRQVPIEIHWNF